MFVASKPGIILRRAVDIFHLWVSATQTDHLHPQVCQYPSVHLCKNVLTVKNGIISAYKCLINVEIITFIRLL